MLSPARARRVLFPLLERSFTYQRYDRFLARLERDMRDNIEVVGLRELTTCSAAERPVIALRHDVDESLESALEMGRLEHARGLRATYFVLHTARYWASPGLVPALKQLQDEFGHEIGWHNDLVTLHCVQGVDAPAYFARELQRLRDEGISIVGAAPHGSPWCYRLAYHNNYFFSDFADELVPGFPNNQVVHASGGDRAIPHLPMADFGLAYDAYHLDNDLYFSDTASSDGRRWHTDQFDLASMRAGQKAVILIHPCHWDRSIAAKVGRLGRYVATRRWREYAVAG